MRSDVKDFLAGSRRVLRGEDDLDSAESSDVEDFLVVARRALCGQGNLTDALQTAVSLVLTLDGALCRVIGDWKDAGTHKHRLQTACDNYARREDIVRRILDSENPVSLDKLAEVLWPRPESVYCGQPPPEETPSEWRELGVVDISRPTPSIQPVASPAPATEHCAMNPAVLALHHWQWTDFGQASCVLCNAERLF